MNRIFLGLVLAGSLAAFLWPVPFARLKPAIVPLLGVVMLGMGMTLTAEDFREVVRRPVTVALGVAAQYGIMPLMGWAVAVILRLPPEVAVGVILVGSCPGGTASNVMTYLARGDVALSVAMTACATLLAPLATPLFTWLLAGQWVPVPAGVLFLDTLKIVVAPVLAGLWLRALLRERLDRALALFPWVSVLVIAVIIAVIVALNAERLVTVGPLAFLAVVLHNLGGFLLGRLLAWGTGLEAPQARALTLEVGMQNSGLGTALALSAFTPLAAVPGAIFSVWHNLAGAGLVTWWARHPDRAPGAPPSRPS